MKKPIIIIGLILSLLGMTFNVYAVDGAIKAPQEEDRASEVKEEERTVEIKEKVISYSKDYVSTNIYKPQVVLENKDIEEKINNKISQAISSFEEEIVSLAKKDNEFYISNKLEPKQYVIYINYIVTKNSDNILSITLSLYSYLGGAHGSTKDVSFNFDTRTGNNGSLKDFFGNSSSYKDIILNNIKKTVAENPEMYFKDAVDKLKEIPYNQKFYLTKDSLVVYFDEYAIAPYVAGTVQFKIPYSEFPEGINKNLITEEAPVIASIIIEKKGEINEYITYPSLENLSDIKVQEALNNKITEDINAFIEVLKSKNQGEGNGITVYYIPLLKERDELILTVIGYNSNAKEDKVIEENKNYIINLNTGEVS